MYKDQVHKVAVDFKRHWFVVLTMCIGMLPLWAGGYCLYILVLLFPLAIMNFRAIDWTCMLIIVFSIIYTFVNYMNGHEYTPSSFIFDLLFPFIVYQAGTYIVRRQTQPQSAIVLLTAMAVCLALPAIVANITDAVTTGSIINVSRKILDETGEKSRSATGYGMMLAIVDGSLGVIMLKAVNKIDSRLKLIIILASLCAVFSTIHLVNRTGIVLSIISMAVVVVLPPHSFKKSMYVFCSLIIAVLAALYFLNETSFIADALESYESRDTGAGSVLTYGGRSELWSAGFSQLFSQPLGNKDGVYLNYSYRYAHNLWIDAGIKGSLPCFFILIAIAIAFFVNLKKIYKQNCLTRFERNVLVLIGVAIFLQLCTEPVIEGVPQFFWYFLFFTSVITSINNKYQHANNSYSRFRQSVVVN